MLTSFIIFLFIMGFIIFLLFFTVVNNNDNDNDNDEQNIKELEQILLDGPDGGSMGRGSSPNDISSEPFLSDGYQLNTSLLGSGIDYNSKYEFIDSTKKEKGEIIFIQGTGSANDTMSILFQRNDVILINVICSFTSDANGVITLTGPLTPWSVYDNSFISGIISTAIQAVTITFTTKINGSNVFETVTFSKNIVESNFVNLIKFNLRNQLFITDPLTANITLPKDLQIPNTSNFDAIRNKAKAFETKAINSFNNICMNRTLIDYSYVDLGFLQTMDISGLKIQSINIDTSSTPTLIKFNVVFANVSQFKLKINSTNVNSNAIDYKVKCGDKELIPYGGGPNADCCLRLEPCVPEYPFGGSCAPICKVYGKGKECTKYKETGNILNKTETSLFTCDLMDTSVSSSGPVLTFDMTIDVSTINDVSVTTIDNFTILNGNVLTSSTTSGCTNILANDTLKNLFNDNVLASAYGNNFGSGKIRNDMSGVLSIHFDGSTFKDLLSSGINRGTQ